MSKYAILNLFSIFHLNLAFSSVEEDKRKEVISRCYWPLLELIHSRDVPVGIEASGYTLQVINAIDPEWIAELKRLCQRESVEFIGSGYTQMIGPLVPAVVNQKNQQLGLDVYGDLLDCRPALALVNEQAYSSGLVGHYLDAGYRGIVMEWDNPSNQRRDWQPNWRYLPQRAKGVRDESIPLLWNKSLPFQQVQRYAHGEIELDEYLGYLESHLGEDERVFSFYGNDAEIFDFRPGRFQTESCQQAGEWQRLERLFAVLQEDSRYRFILPSAALELLDRPGAGRKLELQSTRQPIPVKKQAKYNILRWAVTGRDDLFINSCCHRICRFLTEQGGSDEQWRELCYLWSSDFRTHITEARWQNYLSRLERMVDSCAFVSPRLPPPVAPSSPDGAQLFSVTPRGRFLDIVTESLHLSLNVRRGLAIESLALADAPELSLIGTLPHGYFDQIGLGADFYTGHLVAEIPGDHKLTDLSPVTPELSYSDGSLVVTAEIATPFGGLIKKLIIPPQGEKIDLQYRFNWERLPQTALRLGHITLNPKTFDRSSLYCKTHNGGFSREDFALGDCDIDHLASPGFLVSAAQGLGITEGVIELGDAKRQVQVWFDPGVAALTGHLQFRLSGESYLCRLVLSAREVDDTCSASRQVLPAVPDFISLRLQFS